MQIPQAVTNYSIFKDGRRLIGLADVTLPNLQNVTDTLKGSGILGEIDVPIQGNFQAMTVTFNWITVTDDLLFATIQNGAELHAWAAQQLHDSQTNRILQQGWRYIFGTLPRSLNFGKLEVGAKGEAVTEYEVVNMRVFRNDRVVYEFDKENAICRSWDGHAMVDNVRSIRQFIGL
jgi:uncharacterized protein